MTEKYSRFRQELTGWYRKSYKQEPIFWGNTGAWIVSISQAPSRNVMLVRRPFADKSGEKLRKEWYKVPTAVFYNPNNFYFTTMSKVFPGKNKKGGDKKPPFIIARKWLLKERNFSIHRFSLSSAKWLPVFFSPKRHLLS